MKCFLVKNWSKYDYVKHAKIKKHPVDFKWRTKVRDGETGLKSIAKRQVCRTKESV